MLAKKKIEYFKKKLEEERARLEKSLERVGKRNPNVPDDWEVTAPESNISTADKSEIASAFEELETRAALEDKLEERLTFVNQALLRIKKKSYGICQTCKIPVEEKRLEVNPVARNCIKHAKNNP